MRTMSLGQSHRRAFQLGLVSVAALALTACSSDSDRISLFGVDQQQPATVIAVQPGYVQPGTTYQVAPNVTSPQVASSAQPLTTPAPYTAPTYTAPGYPQTTASIGQTTYQVSPTAQALPQPVSQPAPYTIAAPQVVAPQLQVTQPTYQVAQRSRVSAPTAHLAQTPGGLVGAQVPSTRQVQQVQFQQPQVIYTQPVYQPVYQQPAAQVAQLPAPAPLTTASIGTPQRLTPDPITTASVAPPLTAPVQSTPQSLPAQLPATQPVQTSREAGWSAVGGTRVQIQSGETLYSVSRRYGIPVDVLQRVNNLSDANAVRVGQQIIIPVYSTASASPVTTPQNVGVDNTFTGSTPAGLSRVPYMRAPAPTPRPSTLARSTRTATPVVQTAAVTPAQTAMPTAGSHVVNSGDTVYSIARRYNMPVQQLIAANAITNPNSIRIGQRLIVASSGAGQALPPVAAVPATTQTPAQVVAARTYTPPQPTSTSQAVQQTATIQQVAARQDEIAEQTPLQFRWPIRGRVLSGFGTLPNGVRNDGVNIAVPEGASIRAAEEGEIVYAGNELRGFGNLVLVQHRNGYVTAYAHNSRIDVRRGDRVSRGDIIARAGSTGDVDTPQLHFEIRRGTTPVDPSPYLPQG